MFVGVCRLTLMVPKAHSLKAKRMVLRRVKDRTRHKFNVSVAEVADHDLWQQAVVGFAVVANERAFVETSLRRIIDFVRSMAIAEIVSDEIDIVAYGGGELSSSGWSHWEPEA